jgi:hypothetical protein
VAVDVVGFTGTRSLWPAEYQRVLEWLDQQVTQEPDGWVTGACKGFDAFVGIQGVRRYQRIPHRVYVPRDTSQVDRWWLGGEFRQLVSPTNRGSAATPIVVHENAGDYRQRNQRIVFMSDRILAVAAYPEDHGRSRRSGTWMTVRMARKAENIKSIRTLVLREE